MEIDLEAHLLVLQENHRRIDNSPPVLPCSSLGIAYSTESFALTSACDVPFLHHWF